MNRVVLIVTLLLTAGCASTGPPPPHLNSDDPWAAVVALRRGSDVVVLVSCLDERQPPCDTDGFAVGYRVRLEGTLVEATATSILVDARTSDADPVAVARSPVAALYEVETESSYLGTLIGAAIGTTFCAFAGLYGEEDFVVSAQAMITAVCAGGGAAIGYLANRDPPKLRIVYERPARSAFPAHRPLCPRRP